ncbi:MAG: hypothetical protein KA343_10265 [Nitrosomonas sp.]|nr:hypothetical protein [Nitrosomonas sp.]
MALPTDQQVHIRGLAVEWIIAGGLLSSASVEFQNVRELVAGLSFSTSCCSCVNFDSG